jgi:hypothetical protein
MPQGQSRNAKFCQSLINPYNGISKNLGRLLFGKRIVSWDKVVRERLAMNDNLCTLIKNER